MELVMWVIIGMLLVWLVLQDVKDRQNQVLRPPPKPGTRTFKHLKALPKTRETVVTNDQPKPISEKGGKS